MRNRPNHPGVVIPALIAVALLFLQPGCRSGLTLPGQWLTVPVTAAGGLEDFSRKITSHLFENGMMIGLGNDENNLYLFFTPDFRPGGSQPGRATLTLWLDAQGGQARKLGLIHSFGPVAAAPPPRPGPGQGDDNVVPGPPASRAQELLKVIDRGQGKETFIPADGSLGPAVRLTNDWGDLAPVAHSIAQLRRLAGTGRRTGPGDRCRHAVERRASRAHGQGACRPPRRPARHGSAPRHGRRRRGARQRQAPPWGKNDLQTQCLGKDQAGKEIVFFSVCFRI